MVRVLVTNDDGVNSEGLRQLALFAHRAGHEVVVAAPATEASGSSAAVNVVEADGRVVVDRLELPGLDGVPVYGVAALPGFIALLATRGAFEMEPDLVLSGINWGHNAGQAVLHSGTVGAALTAANNGCSALAVSMDVVRPMPWATAHGVIAAVLPLLLDAEEPLALNLNVPSVPADELRGLRPARLASFGAVQTTIAEVGEGFLRVEFAATGELEAGTDAALLAEGYATLTAIEPLCEAADRLPPNVDELLDQGAAARS